MAGTSSSLDRWPSRYLGAGVVVALLLVGSVLAPTGGNAAAIGHSSRSNCARDHFGDSRTHFDPSVGRPHRGFTVDQWRPTFWHHAPKRQRIHLPEGSDDRNATRVKWSLPGSGPLTARTSARLFGHVNAKVRATYGTGVGRYHRVFHFPSVTRHFLVPRGQSIWWNGTEHFTLSFQVSRCSRLDQDWVVIKKGIAHGYHSTVYPPDRPDLQMIRCAHSNLHDAFSNAVRHRTCV